MKKKILFIHVALWKGGIETALTSMLSEWITSGMM